MIFPTIGIHYEQDKIRNNLLRMNHERRLEMCRQTTSTAAATILVPIKPTATKLLFRYPLSAGQPV